MVGGNVNNLPAIRTRDTAYGHREAVARGNVISVSSSCVLLSHLFVDLVSNAFIID